MVLKEITKRIVPGRLSRLVLWWVVLLTVVLVENVGAQSIQLTRRPAFINDGDTFEADLNANGRLDFPQERIRLLFVDTPELSQSKKGLDRKFGLPAQHYLEKALAVPPIVLVIPSQRPTDKFGRTLAVVRVGGREINLELIRAGHSPFDTRFSFPLAYDHYALAEAEAFSQKRGIWSSASSRKKYIKRLQREGKTPRSPENTHFAFGVNYPEDVLQKKFVRKFVRIHGVLAKRRKLGNGAWVMDLEGTKGTRPLPVFVSGRRERQLNTVNWPPKARLVVDGFVKQYKGTLELTLHHGRLETSE